MKIIMINSIKSRKKNVCGSVNELLILSLIIVRRSLTVFALQVNFHNRMQTYYSIIIIVIIIIISFNDPNCEHIQRTCICVFN